MNLPAVIRVFPLLLLLLTLAAAGCSRPAEPPPTTAKARATPTPNTESAFASHDLTADASEKLKRKADKTIKSLNGFLKNEDPRFQEKLQKLTDKILRDKDGWRKKLQQKRNELQPQIDQLKEQVAKAEGKSRAEVDRQLATLEAQSHVAEKKLSELEGASGDAWKKFKAQMKAEEAKGNATKADDTDMPPTPTP